MGEKEGEMWGAQKELDQDVGSGEGYPQPDPMGSPGM